jgi:HEAT repeat protein
LENESLTPADWIARRRRLDSLLRLQALAFGDDSGMQEAVRTFADSLSDPEVEVRELAAAGLSEFGPGAQIALPELIRAMQDESAKVRRRAIRAIGEIGPAAADDALASLIAATEDEDESVAMQAAASIGCLGDSAAPAVPALMAAIWSTEVRRRAIAGVALTRIGAAAIPALIESLRHPSRDVRIKVIHLLGSIGGHSHEARESLETLQSESDAEVRQEIDNTLRCMSNAAPL